MDLLNNKRVSLTTFLDTLSLLVSENNFKTSESIISELIDKKIIEEIQNLPSNISVEFGGTLRDLKCTIIDDEGGREHVVYLKYNEAKKLKITSLDLPYSQIQDEEYASIGEVIIAIRNYVHRLASYLYQLESIDNLCTVMEPVQPSYKDEFRRIALDNRTWLHIEVTHDGLATDIHLVGHSDLWQDKLQKGLLNWDHDKNIVDNVMSIFDDTNLCLTLKHLDNKTPAKANETEITCAICFCVELPDMPGLPQPLCQNFNCGVYFHKYCLFQWLVACEGGRLPAFGVANGSCPTCLQPIACNEHDS